MSCGLQIITDIEGAGEIWVRGPTVMKVGMLGGLFNDAYAGIIRGT